MVQDLGREAAKAFWECPWSVLWLVQDLDGEAAAVCECLSPSDLWVVAVWE